MTKRIKPSGPCSESGCSLPARIMTPVPRCNKHYIRVKRHGNATVVGKGFVLRMENWRRAHPLVQQLVAEVIERQVTLGSICKKAGQQIGVVEKWKSQAPGLYRIEAMWKALGYDLIPVPRVPHVSAKEKREAKDYFSHVSDAVQQVFIAPLSDVEDTQ